MIGAIVIGFILDLIFGDPYNFPHIIRLMGNAISFMEKLLLGPKVSNQLEDKQIFSKTKKQKIIDRLKGLILVLFMLILFGILPIMVLEIVYAYNIFAGFVIESFICYQMIAAKSLKVESMKVHNSLVEKDVIKSRLNVSMIVGRDTKNLDFDGIAKAAVETVAENTSDGVVAPLIYMFIGGGGLGMMYKAINTMDSMVGYKNDRYIDFGYFPAKLDDIVNFIPARVGALLMIATSFILGYDYRNAFKIFVRDRYNHKSPNSAQTESVCAGALGIKLAGAAYYFGKLYEKPYIGDDRERISPKHIIEANRLMYGTSVLCLGIGLIIRIITIY